MCKDSVNKGFTLVELMIVVAIMGILASIAIPAFIKYVKQSKTAEAGLNLKTMADGAAAYYEVDHYQPDGLPVNEKQFPTSDGTLNGTTSAKNPEVIPPATKHPVVASEWSVEPWNSLKFMVAKPHYYRYRYQAINAGGGGSDRFTSNAESDLDNDGDTSKFNIRGTSNASGEVLLSPVFLSDLAKELE
jgi:prepilin-type N-terminal cleavage/methylation domain-containing protein